jgi:hypothetical protein
MPLNRFIAFVKPYINLLAGALAAYVVAKANVLGIPGLDEQNTATWVAGALVWLLTQGATQLGDLKWLKGHHIALATASGAPITVNVPDRPLDGMAGTMGPRPTLNHPHDDGDDGDDQLPAELADREPHSNPPPDEIDQPEVQS